MKRYLFNQVRVLCLQFNPGGEPLEVAHWVNATTTKYSVLCDAVREQLDGALQYAEVLYDPKTLDELTR